MYDFVDKRSSKKLARCEVYIDAIITMLRQWLCICADPNWHSIETIISSRFDRRWMIIVNNIIIQKRNLFVCGRGVCMCVCAQLTYIEQLANVNAA